MVDAVRNLITEAMHNAKAVQPFSTYAPSNIALSKYWGKRDAKRNLPLNSSVSISLAQWGSHTSIAASDTGHDTVTHNGKLLDPTDAFLRRALGFVELFRASNAAVSAPLNITTRNTIPTAAGLASSASGFAALTRALCGAYGLDLDDTDMSRIARIGSGSAARSLWHGFVRWDKGVQVDGADSHGVPLGLDWSDFRIAIIAVDKSQKLHTSRDGMNHTAKTSPLFAQWPTQADQDCQFIEQAIAEQRFTELGERVEANALAMHATMQAARPALTYLTSQSWQVIEQLWQARAQGLNAYATMDAGANIKLIFLEQSTSDVLSIFPQANVISPFEPQDLR